MTIQMPIEETVAGRAGGVGRGRAPGTFGELLQGILGPGTDFLVTFPVDLYVEAVFEPDPQLDQVIVSPPHKNKARRLATGILSRYGVHTGGWLMLNSALPEGKGMASSTADLVATARAVDSAFRLKLPNRLLKQMMAEIEPSDGVMHPGITAFFHRQVRLHRRMGTLPQLTIAGIDDGESVDTVAFNRSRKPIPAHWAVRYGELLDDLTRAVRDHDLAAVGRVASASARLFQTFNAKPHLAAVEEICRDVGGLGTVVGHSGTCLGILLARHDPEHGPRLARALTELERLGRPLIVCRSTSRT
ncbi:GHMP family kinase ATP-binding protein [Streptosporangium vulgare]|uniref:Kinase n=1 Tax=Streptosporangium vulgare TaxID=46190 RepID=A0ABV5TPM8_9ACTN